MRIIKSIRIKNFRSIINTTRGNIMEFSTENMNIIVGENDAGKSNILKALNLFFNGVTDVLSPFNYDKDLSYQKVGKRKANKDIEIILIISPPRKQIFNFTGKGDVKWTKTWYADNEPMSEKFEYVDTPSVVFQKDYRNTYYKWLKKIKFRYIPAIKSERYFSSLMADLYDILPSQIDNNEGWLGEEGFINKIQDQTKKISNELMSHLGFNSVIQFPGDFRDLFSTLEFSDKLTNVTLNRKGDGIKVRHIPIILKHMADQEITLSSTMRREPIANTIWGFEEPENNLEFKNEQKLANSFKQYVKGKSSVENDEGIQLFITTHSPVFYTLSENDKTTNTLFVKKNEDGSSDIKIVPKDDRGKRDLEKQMNLDPLIALSSKWKELNNSLELQKQQLCELTKRIEKISKPILITEGKTDTSILKTAWKKLYDTPIPFDIIPADTSSPDENNGGNAGASVLPHFANSVRSTDTIRIVLWDYDNDGIKHFKLNKNFSLLDEDCCIKVHNNNKSFAMILPPHHDLSDFVEAENLPIEFYFDKEFYEKRDKNGKGILLKNEVIIRNYGQKQFKQELTDPWFSKISGDKVAFADNIVPTLPKEAFSRFELLFEKITTKILKIH